MRLRAKPDGGVRVLERPEDVPPDQLARLRAHKDDLASILAAYGEAEVVIRPATPVLTKILVLPFVPPLTPAQRNARRKWLGRPTARFGLVNLELPHHPFEREGPR